MTVSTLIASNTPNLNGRTYSLDVLEKIAGQIKNGDSSFGMIGYKEIYEWDNLSVIELRQISHSFQNPIIENNILYVDIIVFDTPQGKVLQNLMVKTEIIFRPFGHTPYSNIIKEITAENYTFISFNAVPKSTDAFEGLL